MGENPNKKRLGRRAKTALLTSLSAGVCLAFFAVMMIVNSVYQDIYRTPKPVDGVADFGGYIILDKNIHANLGGEWEFFYNQWIVTDGTPDAEADCIIEMPKRWTGLKVDGRRLPRTGYASYRMTMKNVEAGQLVNSDVFNCEISYRLYANGQLVTSYGDMSREINAGYLRGDRTRTGYTTPKQEDVVLIIELSGNSLGGLTDTASLSVFGVMLTLNKWMRYLPAVSIGILIALLLINIVMSLAVYRDRRELSSVFFFVALFVHIFSAKDVFYLLVDFIGYASFFTIHIFNYLSSLVMCVLFVYHLLESKIISMPRRAVIVFFCGNVLLAAINFLMLGSAFQWVPILLSLLSMGYILFLLSRALVNRVKFAGAYLPLAVIMILMPQVEAMDFLGLTVYGVETYPLLGIFLVMFLLNLVYLLKMRETFKQALSAMALEREVRKNRYEALRAQVNPHFIFNSLTSIQSRYAESLTDGNEALTRFSRHLRRNIDADNYETIPFEDELENINNYVELENLRLSGRLTLLFDAEVFDFSVPPLSLQPLVENAIKYARTQEREDGFIQIRSYASSDGGVCVEVLDNGVGFDPAAVRLDAHGLKNITERLRFVLDASVRIESVLGEGTRATILIPKKADLGQALTENKTVKRTSRRRQKKHAAIH